MVSIDAWLERLLRRLPLGSRLVALQNRLASFIEQGIQGVANVLVNVILARSLTHRDFATIGMMLGIHYFVAGMHRSGVVLPFILDASSDDGAGPRAEGRWWWFNLLSVAAIAGLLALATLVTMLVAPGPENAWFRDALSLSIIVTPALILFEFGRRILYQRRLPVTAAVASMVYLVLNLGIAFLDTRSNPTPASGAMAWVVAGVGGAMIATIAAPPGRPALGAGMRVWWANRHFAFWQALTNFPFAVYNSSVAVIVGIFGGAPAVAAFTAARTLTNPAISMVTAVDSLDKPRAARALASGGLPGLRQSIGRTRRLLALITGLYLGAIILFTGPVMHLAFGDVYANQVNEIRVLALAFFMICMNQPSETKLIVLRASKLLLVTRLVAATFAIGSLAVGSKYGLMGSCLALLTTHVVNLSGLRLGEWMAERRWFRAQPRPGPPIASTEPVREKVSS